MSDEAIKYIVLGVVVIAFMVLVGFVLLAVSGDLPWQQPRKDR